METKIKKQLVSLRNELVGVKMSVTGAIGQRFADRR